MTTETMEDRRNALDAFANSTGNGSPSLAPSVRPLASPVDRVFGAQQVAVYRDEAKIFQKLAALAAAAGSDWYYRFPVKTKGGGKDWIEGPSIKLANDVARIYGNCDVDTRVIDLGDSWVFYARFTDFETGYSLTRPFQQRKSQRGMATDNDRALDIAFQIGTSKAIRNVVANALQTFADYAFQEARNSLVEKIGKDIAAWRGRTIHGLENLRVELVRVEAAIGRTSENWTAPDIAKIIAMGKAIQDGMAIADEMFPPIGAKAEAETTESEKTETADNAAQGNTASPQEAATASPASGQSAPDTQQQPSQSVEAEKGADKAAATTKEKKGGNGGEFVPSTDAEYSAFASAWMSKATNADDADGRWKAEKPLRKKCHITQETFDELETALKKRVTELRSAGTGEP